MSALHRANECPSCKGVHGDAPAYWPTCPEHGHWLHERRSTEDGIVYGCPGWRCKHTHTQKERITMTTDQAAGAALAIRDGQELFDSKQLAALKQLGIDGASNADLAVFMHRCQATGLDPFSKQITMIQRGGKWTIQTEIDGYRVIAHRAAKRDGVVLSYGPTEWYDDDGNAHRVWVRPVPPAAASVTVYRDNRPFPGVARYASFAALTKAGQPMANWATMPDHMIAKCAEAQALRKAFPQDLDGLQTADETAHLPQNAVVRAAQVYSDAAQPPIQGPRRQADDTAARETFYNAIGREFDRIGLEDLEERGVYVAKLANQEPDVSVAQLTDGDLRFVLDSLKGCDDIGELNDLCAVEAS